MEQRDGSPFGQAYFHVKTETQRMKEFTKEEVIKFREGKAVDNRAEEPKKRRSSLVKDI
jgi:hypothetical protein